MQLKISNLFPLEYLCNFTQVNSLKKLSKLNSQLQTIVMYAFIIF